MKPPMNKGNIDLVNKSAQELIQSDPQQDTRPTSNIKGKDRQIQLKSQKMNRSQAELVTLPIKWQLNISETYIIERRKTLGSETQHNN